MGKQLRKRSDTSQFGKSDMLKKEIRKENETQSENFIYPGASLQIHHTLVKLKHNCRGNGVTYLTHKKRYLVLHEPPLIKSCTDIELFLRQPLHLNYPTHMQSVERAVKMTTTASRRTAGSKGRLVKHCILLLGRKKQWIEKKILCHKKSCSC